MPPLRPWRSYQHAVSRIGADILASLAAVKQGVRVEEEAWQEGANGPHRVDVLVKSGTTALFIECKHYLTAPVTKNLVAVTLYNFLDVCRANPDFEWRLVFVAPTDIPSRARLPAVRSSGLYVAPSNLSGKSLADSTHFIYFDPPGDPQAAVPFFVTDESVVSIGPADFGSHSKTTDLLDRLHDPRHLLSARVEAGMGLATREPALLRDETTSRILIHGLMHLGRPQEALFIRKLAGREIRSPVGAVVEEHMMRFQLAQRRYPHVSRAGARSIESMRKMIGGVPLLEEVSIKAFIGPVIARWGYDDGSRLLDSIESQVDGLDLEEGPYYELLRLVRTAQLAKPASQQSELLEGARDVSEALPIWNRFIGNALIVAAGKDMSSLHGLDVPFDVEEWVDPDAELPELPALGS